LDVLPYKEPDSSKQQKVDEHFLLSVCSVAPPIRSAFSLASLTTTPSTGSALNRSRCINPHSQLTDNPNRSQPRPTQQCLPDDPEKQGWVELLPLK